MPPVARRIAMKDAIREVMSQFYADGVPSDAVARSGSFPEVRNNATVVKGERIEHPQIRGRTGIKCTTL